MPPAKQSRRSRELKAAAPKAGATCKTCTPCRHKKVKCNGARPRCLDCETNNLECVYPRDARRELRPSRARVQSLENTVAVMLEHLKASGVVLPDLPLPLEEEKEVQDEAASALMEMDTSADFPLPTPSLSTFSQSEPQQHLAGTPGDRLTRATPLRSGSTQSVFEGSEAEMPPNATPCSHHMSPSVAQQHRTNSPEQTKTGDKSDTGLSPCEARVAGVYHEHGCVSSVHGLAGIMNPTCRERHKENISKITRKGQTAISETKARLISNAVLQKQREQHLLRQPLNLMDLDGCAPELAKHLLDLHFNRQHYAYLVTYRPSIMDSLASGGGPWANKLLLNAIFYSSALYSDRQCLKSDPDDTQTSGYHFYNRFRQLLVDEIDRPSIPSAVALLLASASLVSQGRSSAGWALSGTAYRMILDLGCHMMLGPDYQSATGHSGQGSLHRDLEQETRKRLYWGAYVTDATQSLYLGRPGMLTSVEARVPLQLLDTFEELEDWQPYRDPQGMGAALPNYEPHSAHAVSTFTALAHLMQISTKITDLYGIQSIKLGSEALMERKRSIEWELENWQKSLPDSLRFDPEALDIPPPHLLTPHTTYHALTILLHRAFLDEGHLRRHSSDMTKKHGEEACIESALIIQKYVRAYRNTFTLRRAPFLLSYAIYSAVTVIVRQERHERGRFTEPISFFWTCLHELQRGCNFGLKKPLAILQEMVHEIQLSVNEGSFADPQLELYPSFDDSLFATLPITQEVSGWTPQTNTSSGNDISVSGNPSTQSLGGSYASFPDGMLDFLNDQEKDIYQDSLYGLFAPSQHFP